MEVLELILSLDPNHIQIILMVDSLRFVHGNMMQVVVTLIITNNHTYSICLELPYLSEALCIAKLGPLLYKCWLYSSPYPGMKISKHVRFLMCPVPATVSLYLWHISFVYVTFHQQT